MSRLISASVEAAPLFVSTASGNIPAIMGGIYIHGLNATLARQWITALQTITTTEEENNIG